MGWSIEISGAQNCFQNFDSTSQSGEIVNFNGFIKIKVLIFKKLFPLCAIEFPLYELMCPYPS